MSAPTYRDSLHAALADLDQARADLAAAHTREAALRERIETAVATWESELASGAIRDKNARYCWTLAAREIRAALDGTDQQPGDAT